MKTIKLMILLALISFMTTETRAQDDADVYNEAYARAHIAYSDFMKLGVTSTTYAKCVKAINYHEPGKVPRISIINGEEFKDDGSINDIKANDGILTSTKETVKEKGAVSIAIGTYQMPNNTTTVFDEKFIHENAIPGINGFTIKCKFVWVSCATWAENIRRFCYIGSWPFSGYLALTECEVGWSSPK